jgi:transcriptional regulator GlxA family with amidase domain
MRDTDYRSSFRERHLTVAELASLWNLSQDTIRRLFLDEPGVIVIHRPRRRARTYKTLRIPESIAQQVYVRLVSGGPRR